MLRFLLIIMALTTIIPTGISAQEVDQRWFFAEDGEVNQIIAYNRAGEISPVMDLAADDELRVVRRIDAQTVLVTFEHADETQSMTVLTPRGATPISYTFDQTMLVVAYHYPFAVYMPLQPTATSTPAVLVNLEAATATTLDANAPPVIEARPCCRFSEDGTLLRYVAKIQLDEDDRDRARFELRERDLQTGEEREISTAESYSPDSGVKFYNWQPDSDGDRWLVVTRQADEEANQNTIWLLTMDRQATFIDEINSDAEFIPVYHFTGDWMWATDARCEGGCTLDVFDDQRNIVLSVQAGTEYFIQRLIDVGEDYVIAETSSPIFRMTPDAPPETIGFRDLQQLEGAYRSRDGRLVTMMDAEEDGRRFFIYDTVSGESIYSRDFEDFAYIFTSRREQYFLAYITARVDGEFRNIYVITDPTTSEMVEVSFERANVSEILSLDELIVWERDREADTNQLSLYSPRSGSKTVLLGGDYFPIGGWNIEDAVRDY